MPAGAKPVTGSAHMHLTLMFALCSIIPLVRLSPRPARRNREVRVALARAMGTRPFVALRARCWPTVQSTQVLGPLRSLGLDACKLGCVLMCCLLV
eukprot:8195796-Pyramimonas_sp.AAC.1